MVQLTTEKGEFLKRSEQTKRSQAPTLQASNGVMHDGPSRPGRYVWMATLSESSTSDAQPRGLGEGRW